MKYITFLEQTIREMKQFDKETDIAKSVSSKGSIKMKGVIKK